MIEAILEGILLGLVLALAIGPVFFSLIQTSIEKGLVHGILFATGIMLGDLFCILLVHYGINQLIDKPAFTVTLGIAGSILLMSFGIFNLLKKATKEMSTVMAFKLKPLHLMAKGFSLNILNPSVIIFWIGAVSFLTLKEGNHVSYVIISLVATLATVFFTDILKVFTAYRIRNHITEKLLYWINKITGIVLVLFGLFMLYKTGKILL